MNESTLSPMAFAINGGTAFPIWVYFGTSLSHDSSFDFPPALVRRWFDCHRKCVCQEKIYLAHSLTEKDLVENSECSRPAWM